MPESPEPQFRPDQASLRTVPLIFERRDPTAMAARADAFRAELARRRSVREFSPEPLPEGLLRAVLDPCIAAAGSAPSGANQQPWTFVVVTDPALKRAIRLAAEEEERAFYSGRASEEWLAALAPLGTDWSKPFLEVAPALIVVFRQAYGWNAGVKHDHYYTQESVGIAVGFLLAALHHAGLATLTHTPSPMKFLATLLARPENEKPYVLIPVGLPAAGCRVPDIGRKSLDEIRSWR
ncbi:MAG: nitroreductase family protein [Planctomycetes bacterium]|jgi:iodotyrosine deiodinase|nr:nitroreductase family protein [Planctomycetota bacterium]